MRLSDFYKQKTSNGVPLVLVTVYETAGSTYSKAGGQMIIDGDGNFFGMLSGGCLEGDLVERARSVIRTGDAQTASYDLSSDDELWGLGVGCDGTMHVLLQPLLPESDYQPFATVADILEGGEPARVAIVIRSDDTAISPGASLVMEDGRATCFGMGDEVARAIADDIPESVPAHTRQVEIPGGRCVVLFASVAPPPALLILGAGLDSEPVVRIAMELGWRCTVVDHRPAYIEGRSYPDTTETLCAPVDELSDRIDFSGIDMAVVMSHHLASDRSYLRQLARSGVGYVGLLGPPGRRDRLVSELGDAADALAGRLHGPAGIDLGGRGPGPIALAIIAEIQQYLGQQS